MSRNFLFCVVSLVFMCPLFPQEIRGLVKSAKGREPLEAVLVYIKGQPQGTETDSSGGFKLQAEVLPATLYFEIEGYYKDSVRVQSTSHGIVLYMKEELATTLEEVVISGTMTERRLLDSPIPVEVYSPALFKKNPSPSIFESLGMINGVQPQINCNVCNTGDIHINGLEGPYTMVLIDGMPIISSLATVYGFQGIPQSLIKRVEVVKGPSSTLYGSEAVAGVINIITKDPETIDRVSTDFSITSLGELNLDGATKYTLGNTKAMLGLNYFTYGHPKDINNDGFTDVTLQQRVSVFNKYAFARTSKKKALFSVRYVYEDRWGGQLGYRKELRGSDSIYSESVLTNRIELIGTYQMPGKENLRFDYSYNYHLQDSYYGTTKYYADQHTLFGQLVWDKTWRARLSNTTGLPVRYTRYNDNTPATTKASETLLSGIFTQWEYKFNTKHSCLLGLRYDRNSLHGNIFTPRLSYKLSLSPKSVIRLTTGSGYRVVNVFTEDHAALTGSRALLIRANLQPEKTWNGNLNFSRHFVFDRGFASLDASTFYTYFFNKIIPDYTTDPNLIIYDNIEGYAVSRGFSLNTELQLRSGFKANIGGTYLDVYRVETGIKTPQMLSPKFSLKWALTYEFGNTWGSVDLTGDLKSPMHLPVVPNDFRPAMSPTFCLLGLQYTKKAKNAEFYLGAKNILNFVPKYPLLRPFDPFDKSAADPVQNPYGYTFDTTYNYAPIQGLKWYFGVRWTLG